MTHFIFENVIINEKQGYYASSYCTNTIFHPIQCLIQSSHAINNLWEQNLKLLYYYQLYIICHCHVTL